MIIECPLPTALEDIPDQTCPIRFDQIVRIIFQRVQAGAGTFTSTTIKVVATWTPLLVAADNTKVVPTPIFAEMVIPQSEAQVSGGNDNTTFNGIPQYNGEGFVNVTAQIQDLDPAIKVVLDKYTKYSMPSAVGVSRLTAFLVNKDGQIINNNYKGFPIYNFSISSVGSEGFNAPNKNQIRFAMLPNWADGAFVTKPTDFDPLILT